jgi:hypothetical protein
MNEPNPEQLKRPEAGPEFYEAAQTPQEQPETRRFRTEAERDALADQVKSKVITPKTTTKPEEVHYEAGIPLPAELKTEKDKIEAVQRLMNSKASGHEQVEALKELLE